MAAVTLSVLAACGSPNSSLSARITSRGELFVAAFADPAQPGSLVPRVDLRRGRVDPPLRTTVTEPAALAGVPGTGDLVVVGAGDDQLVEVDAATGAILRRVTVGLRPDAVALTAGGRTALVADGGSGQLSVVDLATGQVVATRAIGSLPTAVATTPTRAVVVDERQGVAVPVALPGLQVGAPVAVGTEPDAVAIAPGGATALVAALGSDSLTPLDLRTGAAGPPVPVGVPATGVAVTRHPAPGATAAGDPAGTAWVTGGDVLVPVDLATMAAGPPVRVGHPAEALALTDGGSRAWVAGTDGTVTEVDLDSGRVMRTVRVGGRPGAVVVPGG